MLAELLESERRFRVIADAARDMVTETGSNGRFAYVSPACTEVLGYPAAELLESSPLALLHPDDHEPFVEQLRAHPGEGEAFAVEPHRLRRRDGSWIWVEATGVRYRRPDGEICLIGVARDITERLEAEQTRRSLEGQVVWAQRLEGLGVLAGGIAHDFNNYLTPILGSAGLIEAELPEDSPLRRHAGAIRKAVRRAMALTSQMLAYAGRSEPQLSPLDLSEVVLDMQLLLESTISHRARLALRLETGLPPVRADREQVGQVIMNLVTNSVEAVADASGTISLGTDLVHADRELLRSCQVGGRCDEGPYVRIEVRDDGRGIDESVVGRIFDPFFSTKFTGRGLGLAVVLGIVQGHGGALQVETRIGDGTSIRVLLPVADVGCVDVPDGRRSASTEGGIWAGDGAFLVVDDDEGARELAGILLERAGFRVHCAADGPEAIELLKRFDVSVRGALLDMTMPGMNGPAVLDAIRTVLPDLPIVLTSGYSRERIPEDLLTRGSVHFLPKPFDSAQLEAAIRRLLEPA